ncbi:MAG TPA: vitamin-B12 independent methionine synthase [Candidatus Binatia bacterium]|nr:vitamin-B12 independent methionine synthase [Candidatus Binatia bacterium]
MSEGGYESISRRLFCGVKAQRLLLEYDDDRSGTFDALRDVPDDKFVVLGLITTKKAHVESLDNLRRRITEASRYFALEQLGLSPQCGFASSILGNQISPEDQRRKLGLVVRASQSVWG